MNQLGSVHEATQWLVQHGYALLAAAVLAEQLGAPVPAAPLLLAMGALAGLGHFSFGAAIVCCVVASLIADLIWFDLGRRRGESILGLLCRLSIEPDTCVRLTHRSFDKYGAASIVFCKFVPGLSTIAPPLAGSSGMSVRRFVALDLIGATLWSSAYLAAGWIFRREIESIFATASNWGGWFVVAVFGPLALYIAWKYLKRRRALGRASVLRISPESLAEMLLGDDRPIVLDLRARRTVERTGGLVAGARLIDGDEIDSHLDELPTDAHLVFYCSCPNEAGAASVALRLQRAGFARVSALEGGFEAWRDAGLAIDPFGSLATIDSTSS